MKLESENIYILTSGQLAEIDLLAKRYHTALFSIFESCRFDKIEMPVEREQTLTDFHAMATNIGRRVMAKRDNDF
jgi:hypothetical protein